MQVRALCRGRGFPGRKNQPSGPRAGEGRRLPRAAEAARAVPSGQASALPPSDLCAARKPESAPKTGCCVGPVALAWCHPKRLRPASRAFAGRPATAEAIGPCRDGTGGGGHQGGQGDAAGLAPGKEFLCHVIAFAKAGLAARSGHCCPRLASARLWLLRCAPVLLDMARGRVAASGSGACAAMPARAAVVLRRVSALPSRKRRRSASHRPKRRSFRRG